MYLTRLRTDPQGSEFPQAGAPALTPTPASQAQAFPSFRVRQMLVRRTLGMRERSLYVSARHTHSAVHLDTR